MSAVPDHTTTQKIVSEAVGSFFLFAGVIGSGIMAEALAGGNVAIALLGNTVAVGAILYVLIAMLAPISGAHFNPAVTLAFLIRREIGVVASGLYVVSQLVGGAIGVLCVHFMFEMPILQFSTKARAGIGQWTGEFVATFGLVLTVLVLLRYRAEAIPAAVALYISSAIWFTSSTCFANPAITVIRSLTDTFVGIAPGDAPLFIAAQLAGAVVAVLFAALMTAPPEATR
ncbi:MAG: MIP/aquaporin family protein [Parvularcula sp.]|jgi:glycerol uptake facilitator-like aquaporin|nr:MIP/aquaporin family protein [Parvularcula sp.]